MKWFNWLSSPVCETREEKKYHVRQIGNMIQLPFNGDIIKTSSVRSIVVDHDKVIVVEDNGNVHECVTDTPEQAERVREILQRIWRLSIAPCGVAKRSSYEYVLL